MNANRVLTMLALLVLTVQGVVVYRQSRGPSLSAESIRDARPGTTLDLTGMPIQGKGDAPIVIVEFSDYECPFCARHATTTLRELKERFVSTGQVRYAFANFPLPNHANAKSLAHAAICSGWQGRYWEMHDELFRTRSRSQEEVLKLATDLSLDITQFQACLQAGTITSNVINQDQIKAGKLGIQATPSFVIGHLGPEGSCTALKVVTGAVPITVFEDAIKEIREAL